MDRKNFLQTSIGALATPALLASSPPPETIAGVTVPATDLSLAATSLAKGALPPEIFNHCLRTFVFAELIARAKSWEDHDPEVVYVASILHDTGLSPTHMSERERFEVDGAHAAAQLMQQYGVAPARQELVWDAITLHDNGGLARWKAREVALVNAGVGADFGSSLDLLAKSDVEAVLRAAPRVGFIDAFLPAVAEVAKRKPFATGTCFVTDVAYRMVPGFHLDNFCDEVRDDPFKSYVSRA